MRLMFFIFVSKLVTFVCKLFKKNGTVLPGNVVYDWFKQKKILEKVKYPKYVIAVTGSSGKGSTTSIIYNILTDCGYDVCYNDSGSNGVLAATTLILNNCNFRGVFKHEVLLIECDERHLKLIFGKNKMTHLVITNITRDQPTRHGTPYVVFNDVIAAIDDSVHLVINADDPMVSRLKLTHKGPISTFAIDKLQDDIKKPLLNNIDFAYCPNCHKKLKYEYYHYGHLGKFSCPNCDFSHGKANYLATDVDLDNQNIKINGKDCFINNNVIYAAYATLAAFSLCNVIGIDESTISKSLNSNKIPSKLGREFTYKDRKFIMLETKSENNLSFYQGCKYVVDQKGEKSVVLGFDHVSKRYKDSDLSWLYDINFELLNDSKVDKIFVFGKFKYDIATRLDYAGIDSKKIVLIDNTSELMDIVVKETKAVVYTMIWYDVVDKILSNKAGA